MLAEASFHALGVAEVHLTLRLLYGTAPALLTSFILETTNRLIQVVFKFVPLRLGVDEAGTAVFTQVLGLGEPDGRHAGHRPQGARAVLGRPPAPSCWFEKACSRKGDNPPLPGKAGQPTILTLRLRAGLPSPCAW